MSKRLTKREQYSIRGDDARGYCVVDAKGGTIYDSLESREYAESICSVLNSGIGPDWDDVEAELVRQGKLEE